MMTLNPCTAAPGCVEQCWLVLMIDFLLLQPGQKLRRRPQIENPSYGQRIVITRGLVIQHHIVGARDAHEVIAPRGAQEKKQIVREF